MQNIIIRPLHSKAIPLVLKTLSPLVLAGGVLFPVVSASAQPPDTKPIVTTPVNTPAAAVLPMDRVHYFIGETVPVAVGVSPARLELVDENGKVAAQTTSAFLEKWNCQIAVNGDFFEPFHSKFPCDYFPHAGDAVKVLGAAVSLGEVLSKGNAGTWYLCFWKDKTKAPTFLPAAVAKRRRENNAPSVFAVPVFLLRSSCLRRDKDGSTKTARRYSLASVPLTQYCSVVYTLK